MTKQLGWHFLREDRRLNYSPHRLVKPGMTMRRDPKRLEMCAYGLRWSKQPLDALRYAPGTVVCRVECSGRTIEQHDKCVSSVRRVLWMADATDVLREFARWCALQVIDKWDAPDTVRQYLKTGDESIREAAADAACDAADAACDAAYAACDAACDAAYAACDAACYAAYAAFDAAYYAARATDVVYTGTQDAQNQKLTEMLMKLGGAA